MKLQLTSYHRTFEAPGGPVVWAIRVDNAGAVGKQPIPPFILQLSDNDADLNTLNKELGGPGVWDEDTLIEATRRALALPADVAMTAKAPAV